MAKKKDEDDTTNKVLWLAGGAAISGFVVYFVNKHLTEKEELRRLQYIEQQRKLEAGKGESE